MFWRNTGDAEIKKRADDAVAVLAQCQTANGNGYIGGFPEKSILELEGLVQDHSVHASVPWYCLHKVYAGLLDMYVLTGNKQALDVLEKAAEWIEKNLSQLDDQQMEKMLGTEHGGMKEVLVNLYAVTGKENYLNWPSASPITPLWIRFFRAKTRWTVCTPIRSFRSSSASPGNMK